MSRGTIGSSLRIRPAVVSLLAFCLTVCASAPMRTASPGIEAMTIDEKVGQMFVAAGHANYMSESSPAYLELVRQVRENKVGGVIWFLSNVYETAWLTGRLQHEARIPLLISADLEAGIGMRLLDTTFWPPAMAVAATGDPALSEQQGRITAQEAKVLGINHILAPVADVNVDPDNPVINTRSFGEDPQDVARFVSAFVRGVQSENVLATAKHFPGHGDTHVDSHRSLPVLNVERDRLERVELVPFRAAIEAGVASVMIGHLAVRSLDDTAAEVRAVVDPRENNPYATDIHEIEQAGTVPATLSPKMITGLLRNELGFKGLIVTDAFDMGGLVAHYGAGDAAVRGIEAGEDQILKSADIDAAVIAVREAVRSGRLSEKRIDESVKRILAAKSRVTSSVGTQEEIFRTLDSTSHRDVATVIASRSITLLREEPGALPVRKDGNAVLLVVSDFPEVTNPLAGVERELQNRLPARPETFVIDSRSTDEEIQPFIKAAKDADVVVIGLAVRSRSGAGHLAVPAAAHRAIDQIPANVKTIAVAFGSPYVIRDLPKLKNYIVAWGIQPVLQTAAVRAMFGEAPIGGRLPVTILGLHQRGEGISKAVAAAPGER